MYTPSRHYSFKKVLDLLAKQNPEEKLRIAFHLTEFVNKLRREGIQYGRKSNRHRTREIA